MTGSVLTLLAVGALDARVWELMLARPLLIYKGSLQSRGLGHSFEM